MQRLVLSLAVLACFLAGWSRGAHPFDLTTSDRVALLYSSQLQFSTGGDPLIKIGLLEGAEEIRFTPDSPITVLPLGEGGPEIELPGNLEYQVSLVGGTPGTYRYWAIVARLFEGSRSELASLTDLWDERGRPTQSFSLGSFFATQGMTFDNRQSILAMGGMEDRQDTLALAAELERDHAISPELHAELVQFPSGQLVLSCPQLGVEVRHRDLLWIAAEDQGRFEIPREAFSSGTTGGQDEDRHYVGSLVFTVDSQGKLALVNEIPAERLLEGILPAEIYPSAPMEALKAQAVAARSELLAELGVRHLADPYMVCAQQHCQVYRGIDAETRRTSQAVQETRGQILVWGDHIAHTVYSASCGGYSGSYTDTWGHEPIEYLTPHFDAELVPEAFQTGLDEGNLEQFLTSPVDSYCHLDDFGGANTFRWQVEYTAEELSQAVNQRYDIGAVRGLDILQRDSSGRVTLLSVSGERGQIQIERELPIRRALGGLRSALFLLDVQTGEDGSLTHVTFRGGGFGHGVGLCQTGAIGAARRGIDYLSILSHYYPGTNIRTAWR